MNLSNEQLNKMLSLLQGKRCPVCGASSLYPDPNLYELKIRFNPEVDHPALENSVKLTVLARCNECGHIIPFDFGVINTDV